MRMFTIGRIFLPVILASTPALGEHHISNWVSKSSTDTTVVPCWSDTLSSIAFPPNCMMMMMPDSFFCRADRMSLDSLVFPRESTFLGWYRVRAGRDSVHFDMMQPDTVHGHQQMMQFMSAISCQFHWDSLADSVHRGWHLTGAKVWDGTTWLPVATVSVSGGRVFFASPVVYPAIALTGTPPAVTGIAGSATKPTTFSLEQNYPNPFNPATIIRYELPVVAEVKLVVYDLLGREVAVLADERKEPGKYEVRFDATALPSGMYFYRLAAQSFVQVRKMLLIR